jgi:TolB-like protein/Tfp pilus assembly protein PilF
MKRCPECRRDYYDDTLLYCLDDGNALLGGPASGRSEPHASVGGELGEEPQTAILHATAAPGEAPTRAHIHTTEQTAVLPAGTGDVSGKPRGFDKRLIAAPLLGVLIAVGGYFGYRYLGPVGSAQIDSIAVMPFVNESGNADLEYLSDGMTETLIKSLSQVPNLAVKSRSTVFYYKGKETSPKKIGEELGVQAVLLGRVGGRGDDLKLSLELVNTQTQDVIWAEQYDRKQSDLVSLQSEIAKDVSTNIKAKLSGADEANVTKTGTEDTEAYQAYLKGRYFWNRRTAENITKAIEQFKIATDRDPNYALSYVGLADSYLVQVQYAGVPANETLPKAREAIDRALQIDRSLAEAHVSLGAVHQAQWQWTEAEEQFKRAISLNPNYPTAHHWYATYNMARRRFDLSLKGILRAQELDPLSPIIGTSAAFVNLLQNNPEAAIEQCKRVIEIDPNFPSAYHHLGWAYLKQRQYAEATAAFERAVELSGRAGFYLSDLGYAYTVTGRRSDALAVLKELEGKYVRREAYGLHLAGVHVGLGEKDQAFVWLEKDFQQQSGNELPSVTFRFAFDDLRSDPRYADLVRRMGLGP